MKGKVVVFLCLLALVMMITSEVTARDLAETETASETHELDESLYGGGGGGCGRGGCGGGGGCGRGGCGGGGGGGGGRCRWGCCGGWYYGRCRRCCGYAGEKATELKPESKPHN